MDRGDQKRLLVVDDTRGDIDQLRQAIARAALPWDLRVATTASEAIDVLQGGWIPDLAVIALKLPGTDGSDLTLRIREHPTWRSIRVVTLTASRAEDDIDRSYAAGAAAVLFKPAGGSYDDVVRRIARLFDALSTPTSGAVAGESVLPDLTLLRLAKRCLSNSAHTRRVEFVARMATTAGIDVVAAERSLVGLIDGGFIEQVGCGDDADLYAGGNLSSGVIAAMSKPTDAHPN